MNQSAIRVARKGHACSVCRGGIIVGEQYQDLKVLPNSELGRDCGLDKPEHMRICGSCLLGERVSA